MKEYAYSPYLKKPEQMPDIDPLKPAMRVMLKMITKTQQAETAAFVPPEGVRIRKMQTESADGWSFDTWIAEPENCPENSPAIVLVHGGAFYLPLSVSSLALGCAYAQKMNIRVFLPEYRLVPSFPAPCAFEDCLTLWKELNEAGSIYGINPERLLLMGESAGGAITAGVCLYLKDTGMKLPKGLLLVYPVLDNRTETYQSAQRYEDTVWPLKANSHMWAGYLKNAPEEMMKYLVPMHHEDLSDLPVTYVEPQEIDILCDEGTTFAERLQAAGVKTELNIIPGSYHCFDSDLTSDFVQNVIEQRITAAEAMLETE
ncbi:MAG: alpha/beta hydrolase [Solobacterium sp.]|nr:alpha/beta hydrolase [Solobacterium sp.]